jgi:hypothetical protein
MRATPQEQTGGAGANEVCANFERLDWGPVPNHQHDLGTDVFLQVRRKGGADVGLVVGAQVKAGESRFEAPERDESGEIVGWWYRESDRRHFDYWLSHSIPHLLVLHCMESRVSYWAHITEEAVVSTGAGAKILVPRKNRVDEGCREGLERVARSGHPGAQLEGSIWRAGASIPVDARLRHALVVPRLVAPHPNAGIDHQELSPEQAIAMLMQARLRDLTRFAESYSGVPELSAVDETEEWSWRFAGTLYARVVANDIAPVLKIASDAPSAPARTAAVVAATSALIEDHRADDALPMLDAIVSDDEVGSIDRCWLLMQRARARSEIGLTAEAREDAAVAQGFWATPPYDATASAIRAAAALLLFNTSGWGESNVRAVIEGSDIAASWWRAQTTTRGLWAIMDRAFDDRMRKSSVTIGAENVAHNQLHAAALTASHSGSQSGWCQLSGAAAQNELLELNRHSDPEEVANALSALRLAGDKKALELAVNNLVADGPAYAVTLAAADADLDRSTRTTGLADLVMLQRAGDVLDRETATRTVDWLLARIRDPEPFRARTSASYLLELQFTETLAGVIGACEADAHRRVAEHILELPSVPNELEARAWVRAVQALPADIWTEDDVRLAAEIADRQPDVLRLGLLGLAAGQDDQARERLVAEVAEGSLRALGALDDLTDLAPAVVKAQIESLCSSVEQIVTEAHRGISGFGGPDPGAALVFLNTSYPHLASWNPVLKLLADGAVDAAHKRGVLRQLINNVETLPDALSARLREVSNQVARPGGRSISLTGVARDASAEASVLAASLGALDDKTVATRMVVLLTGSPGERMWAAALATRAACPEHDGVLVALSTDEDPGVRAAAAVGLAERLGTSERSPLVDQAVRSCLEDPGAQVPASLAATLHSVGNPTTTEALGHLREHVSATVRRFATEPRSG